MAFQFNNYLKGALIINQSIMSYLLIALVLTAGTAFLIWLGDQITQFGVGNGISIIIFAGILSTLPASLIQFGQTAFVGQEDTSLAWLKVLGLLVSLILLTHLLPRTLTLFFPKAIGQTISEYANPSNTYGMIVYVVLIIAFTYFYAFVQVNPEKMVIT